MRIGAALLLFLALSLLPGGRAVFAAGEKDFPRGPYLLRQIFGDVSRSSASIWDLAPGIRRDEVPADADLGTEEKGAGPALVTTRDIAGRATVTFVFEGREPAARLNHITVTLIQSPSITAKSVLTHLTKIYGSADSLAAGQADVAGSWQGGAVLLRSFPAARFFEVTLSAPASRTSKDP
jgi:hypothetical protein